MAEATTGHPNSSAKISGHAEVGKQEPDRQKQEVEPVGLGVVIVVQAVLQLAHESEPRQQGMKAKAMEAVLADIGDDPRR
jgi:hypothetical protein